MLPRECGHDGIVVGIRDAVDAEVRGAEHRVGKDVVDADAGAEGGVMEPRKGGTADIGVAGAEEGGGEEGVLEAFGEAAVGVRSRYVVEIAADDDGVGRGVDSGPDGLHLRRTGGESREELGGRAGGDGEQRVNLRGLERVALEVVVEEAEGVAPDDDVAIVGAVAFGVEGDSGLVCQLVFAVDGQSVLQPPVVDGEVEIGVRIGVRQRVFDLSERGIVRIFVYRILLHADDVGARVVDVAEQFVLVHGGVVLQEVGVVGKDGQTPLPFGQVP